MVLFQNLNITGEIKTDSLHKLIYATDASAYRECPSAVIYPKGSDDIQKVVKWAGEKGLTLIPRAGGTSLAGQVVGSGVVVDVSRFMNRILEVNADERWVRVEPGVVLDELNMDLRQYGLFFGPETSTANRCCLGGMVGNNACGSHSLVYGSTREHLLEAKVVLSDGSEVVFKEMGEEELQEKMLLETLEGDIYREMCSKLSDSRNVELIRENFPDMSLTRRNTGYALDELLECFNLCKVLAGSEGTLALVTELKLNLVPLPPVHKAVICVHHKAMEESFYANLVVLEHGPVAVELMDGVILDLSKDNIAQQKNRFFVKGEPEAVLIVELAEHSEDELNRKASAIVDDLKLKGYGYHFPVIYGSDINKVWDLRKAGLGLLSGMPGSAKPVSLIEDTAVAPVRLPDYIRDIKAMLDGFGLSCVYHAHIATGELHLRPILNLKETQDRELFRKVAYQTALIVKKHRGSLSGEHGDGRLRGEFIPLLFGDEVYKMFEGLKSLFDPSGVFNKGKIVATPAMDVSLRYVKGSVGVDTYFDYSKQQGWLCAVEQCNGSGDCRKSDMFGGTMCPSFRATLQEKNATRARANVLREFLLRDDSARVKFNQRDVLEALDTCLSCKACKSECPSNVDIARYKAEYLQHHYNTRLVPSLRSLLFANFTRVQRLGSVLPQAYNAIVSNVLLSSLMKRVLGFAPSRSIPRLYKTTLSRWMRKNTDALEASRGAEFKGEVLLFCDEFSNFLDVEIGISFVKLLNGLGYRVRIPRHVESGRTEMSKGFLKRARHNARRNVSLLYDMVSADVPLVGIEPSCILSFRDEYPDLVGADLKDRALRLSENVLLYDEFIVREMEKGNICSSSFSSASMEIKLHGHCHQKSLASIEPSRVMLELPENYSVSVIPSGCCGMAGSFGYEKEHYELSQKIGEAVLFPAVREAGAEVVISAPGTSCREQIKDGTGRVALHPVEVLYRALK